MSDVLGFLPRCTGCAFTAGTEANKSDITRIKAELCAMAYEPFYCHANAVEDVIPQGHERLCRGWAEAVQGQEYPEEWKRELAIKLLKLVDRCETDESFTEEMLLAEIRSDLRKS